MAKAGIVVLLFTVLVAATPPAGLGVSFGPKAVDKWFKHLPHAKEKITKLHFYYQDIVSGKNPTAYQIAQSNFTAKSPTNFGALSVMDHLLTETPDPNSAVVGRGQGTYGFAALDEVGLLMTLNFFFTQGKYNGSTLSVLGRNAYLNKYREMPIVGGTGVFRLARGIATAQTNYFNVTSSNGIVEYNLVVLHYDIK
ncbi:PREDICTED: dirigent protein 22-like [Ipomoea nil]|uniref:dirigent protein 22-like n=1 Tax=Ipomoea nil TaxID=35883 RepID=UPI0009009041|nr:PREDICTED: dirigent protein 22-like [Ipomoea nil]